MKAIIFDADGMLLLGERFSSRYSREFGVSMETLSEFFSEKFPACVLGKADLREELKPFLSEWKWKGSVDEFLFYWFKGNYLNPDILSVIADLKLRGVGCYLATNQEKYRAAFIKDVLELGYLLNGCFVSSEIGFKKPQWEFFAHISETLSLIPNDQIFFWDDHVENVDAAREYGFQAELYTDLASFKERIAFFLR